MTMHGIVWLSRPYDSGRSGHYIITTVGVKDKKFQSRLKAAVLQKQPLQFEKGVESKSKVLCQLLLSESHSVSPCR
jgi:hypothetical protein